MGKGFPYLNRGTTYLCPSRKGTKGVRNRIETEIETEAKTKAEAETETQDEQRQSSIAICSPFRVSQ
jgi:hypothetical protein